MSLKVGECDVKEYGYEEGSVLKPGKLKKDEKDASEACKTFHEIYFALLPIRFMKHELLEEKMSLQWISNTEIFLNCSDEKSEL